MILLIYFGITILLLAGMLLFRRRKVISVLMLAFLLNQSGLTAAAWLNPGMLLLQYFIFDPLAILFLSLLTVISFTTVIHGLVNLRSDSTRRYQYYQMALTGLIGSVTAATLANHLTVVWIFVEATTLCVSVLIYHEKNRLTLEAVWKYIFVCSVGIAIAYFGILFLGLGLREQAGFELTFREMSLILRDTNPLYLKIAFLFVLVGYSTKIELFPMHTAGVDANSVAQPQISAFISTAMVNLGFVAFYRVYLMFSQTGIAGWMNHVLILTGILSMLTAAGYMLKARHAKRMFAYSTLEIMGLMAIALGLGPGGHPAALLIMISHTLIKSGLFYQLSQFFRTWHSYKIKETGNYFVLNSSGGLVLMAGSMLILAIPPSGLFLPGWLVFASLAGNGQWVVICIVLTLLGFIVYGFSTRVLHMLFSAPVEGRIEPARYSGNWYETTIQWALLAMASLLCFYQPPFLVSLIHAAIQP